MKLTDISYIKAQMERHGLFFKKKFGQNFLTNPNVIERIAENASEGTLEIGPGIGVLTHELCKRCKKVVAVEIDTTLIPLIKENLSEFDNIKIINEDIMKVDLGKLIKEEFSDCSEISVCANLPYYITTPIVMALLESGIKFKSITVMVQKEVAHRFCAKAGDEDYGAITASLSYYGKCQRLFDVSRGNFLPPPNVDSAVMKITLYDKPPVDCKDEGVLKRVIRGAFAKRRKTLSNSMSGEFPEFSKEELSNIIKEAGFEPSIRGEKLGIEQYNQIATVISEKINRL